MTLESAQLLVQAVGLYLGLGGAFALVFAWRWVGRLDAAAEHGTWGFRVLILPGAAALWPLLVVRLLRR